MWHGSECSFCFVVPGDSEAAGLSAAGQLSVAAVQRQVWRGGQVPAHLHAPQAASGAWQDAAVCGHCGPMLPPEALPRAVQHPSLCAKLRASCALQVSVCVCVVCMVYMCVDYSFKFTRLGICSYDWKITGTFHLQNDVSFNLDSIYRMS